MNMVKLLQNKSRLWKAWILGLVFFSASFFCTSRATAILFFPSVYVSTAYSCQKGSLVKDADSEYKTISVFHPAVGIDFRNFVLIPIINNLRFQIDARVGENHKVISEYSVNGYLESHLIPFFHPYVGLGFASSKVSHAFKGDSKQGRKITFNGGINLRTPFLKSMTFFAEYRYGVNISYNKEFAEDLERRRKSGDDDNTFKELMHSSFKSNSEYLFGIRLYII